MIHILFHVRILCTHIITNSFFVVFFLFVFDVPQTEILLKLIILVKMFFSRYFTRLIDKITGYFSHVLGCSGCACTRNTDTAIGGDRKNQFLAVLMSTALSVVPSL